MRMVGRVVAARRGSVGVGPWGPLARPSAVVAEVEVVLRGVREVCRAAPAVAFTPLVHFGGRSPLPRVATPEPRSEEKEEGK